jgi:hypothetical protein
MVLIAVATARQRLVTSFLADLAVGAYIRRLQGGGHWHDCWNEIDNECWIGQRMGGDLCGTCRGSSAAASPFSISSSRFGNYYTNFSSEASSPLPIALNLEIRPDKWQLLFSVVIYVENYCLTDREFPLNILTLYNA